MRILSCLLLVLAGFLSTGCASNPGQTADQAIISGAGNIQAISMVSTKLALLSVPSKDRVKATGEVHTVALDVQTALRDVNPTVQDLGTLVMQVAGKSNSVYAEMVGTLLEAGGVLVDAELQKVYASASTNQRLAAELQLMRSVVDGIVQGSASVVSMPRSATQPSAQNFPDLPKRMWLESPFDIKTTE